MAESIQNLFRDCGRLSAVDLSFLTPALCAEMKRRVVVVAWVKQGFSGCFGCKIATENSEHKLDMSYHEGKGVDDDC